MSKHGLSLMYILRMNSLATTCSLYMKSVIHFFHCFVYVYMCMWIINYQRGSCNFTRCGRMWFVVSCRDSQIVFRTWSQTDSQNIYIAAAESCRDVSHSIICYLDCQGICYILQVNNILYGEKGPYADYVQPHAGHCNAFCDEECACPVKFVSAHAREFNRHVGQRSLLTCLLSEQGTSYTSP